MRKNLFLSPITFVAVVTVLAVVVILLFQGQSLVRAQYGEWDGRINIAHHFGGDALYCVDQSFMATTQYSDAGGGGFRLLSMTGQELWFVPAVDVAAAVSQAKATGQAVLIGQGLGTYGPVSLMAYLLGGDDMFAFSGFDEWGKANEVTFKFCQPDAIAPRPEGQAAGSVVSLLCTLEEVDEAYLSDGGEAAFEDCWERACGELGKDCFCTEVYPDSEFCDDNGKD